jgi:hypothetical protein
MPNHNAFLPRFGCCVWGWKGCVENPAALKGAFWICIFIFISNDKNRISDISVYSVHKECIYETIYISYSFESLGKFLSDWSDWFSVIPGSESQPQWALACRRLGESNLNLICFNQENAYCIYTVCVYIYILYNICVDIYLQYIHIGLDVKSPLSSGQDLLTVGILLLEDRSWLISQTLKTHVRTHRTYRYQPITYCIQPAFDPQNDEIINIVGFSNIDKYPISISIHKISPFIISRFSIDDMVVSHGDLCRWSKPWWSAGRLLATKLVGRRWY